jgi:hypothetical protein
MSLDIVSWLNSNGSAVTAFATVALAVITAIYVFLTNSLLKEQIVARKIQAIEKELQFFYIPLRQHILLNEHTSTKEELEKFKNDTINKDFMKYIYLCEKEEIRSDLEKFLDTRSEIQNELIDKRGLVEDEIKKLVQELEKLQSFGTSEIIPNMDIDK